MSTIAIGPLTMRLDLVVFILSAMFGFLILNLRLRNKEERREILDLLVNAVILGFLMWKFSFLVFHPLDTLENPLSLLYFTGGEKGVWLGIAIPAFYIAYRVYRKRMLFVPILKAMMLAYFSFRLASVLALTIWDDPQGYFRPVQVFLYALLTGWAWLRFESSLKTFLSMGLWYSIGFLFAVYFDPSREPVLAGFTESQILYACFAVGFLVLDTIMTKLFIHKSSQ